MLKILLTLLLTSTLCFSQDLTRLAPDGVSSTVTFDSNQGAYLYTYTFDKDNFSRKHDLSNFFFYVCCDTLLYDFKSKNVEFYEVEINRQNRVKFDDIEPIDDETVVFFSFLSKNVPTIGELTYKFGKYTHTEMEYIPSCDVIPEPSYILLSFIPLLILLRHKRC